MLIFGDDFNNQDLWITKDILGKKLRKLSFGFAFNQSLGKNILPKHLQELIFGYRFSKPLTDIVFPRSLKKLVFGYSFNQQIFRKKLPESLEILQFGYCFDQKFSIIHYLIIYKFLCSVTISIDHLSISIKNNCCQKSYTSLYWDLDIIIIFLFHMI